LPQENGFYKTEKICQNEKTQTIRPDGGHMKNTRIVVLGLLFLFFFACMPNLVPPGWELQGKQSVSFSVEHDSLTIRSQTKEISRLLIVVRVNDLELYGLRIRFENGEEYSPDIRVKLLANRDNQIVDLPGRPKRVAQIDFRYRSLIRNTRRAEIEFWGK